MDPSDTSYHISGDTITYSSQVGSLPSGLYSSWFNLVFDSSSKTISNVSFGYQQNFETVWAGGTIYNTLLTDSIGLTNFIYDSSSIHTTDSSLLFHQAQACYNSSGRISQGPPDPFLSQGSGTLLSVSSMTLSGSFDSITLTGTSGVAMPTASQSNISIIEYDGAVECSFSTSDQARTMELYTPLGVKAANYEILAGQSEISLPHLTSGLYFVRMDGNVIKVAVP